MKRKGLSIMSIQTILILLLSLGTLASMMTGHLRITMIIIYSAVALLWLIRIRGILLARKSLKWPKAQARVYRLTHYKHHSKYGKSIPYLVVDYEYSVEKVLYKGDLYTFFPWSCERRFDRTEHYQRNPIFSVRYNPKKPEQVVEKEGIHAKMADPIFIGISVFLIAFATVGWIFILN